MMMFNRAILSAVIVIISILVAFFAIRLPIYTSALPSAKSVRVEKKLRRRQNAPT